MWVVLTSTLVLSIILKRIRKRTKMGIIKHIIWASALVIIISIICGTAIYLNSHPYILEIGDNALEGIKSINFTEIKEISDNKDYNNPYDNCYFDGCNYQCKSAEGISISTLRYCYNTSENYKEVSSKA